MPRTTRTKTIGGRTVSARSKTGDPACSQAMSDWKRHGMTSVVAGILATCRSKASRLKAAASHRGAGNEAKAQRLEAIASGRKGPVTDKARAARAAELRAKRSAKAAVPAKVAPAGPPDPPRPSLREQADAHRAKKGRFGDDVRAAGIHTRAKKHYDNARRNAKQAIAKHSVAKAEKYVAKTDRAAARLEKLAFTAAKRRAPANMIDAKYQVVTPPKPSLRERAAAHRASKGDVSARPAAAKEIRDARFAVRVHEAAAKGRSHEMFGDNKIFIGDLYKRTAAKHPDVAAMGLDAFKRRLAAANQSRYLSLARADLVEAMDAKQVAESEVRHLGATYNFMRLEPDMAAKAAARTKSKRIKRTK